MVVFYVADLSDEFSPPLVSLLDAAVLLMRLSCLKIANC